ncbi:MAG: type II toxin-antitoxin system RelE/ParE family toxin [Gemmatimonadales bacterium]|nr:type II toxin-antitoxin system RelE/ParE family toxin [Gemmatimonadales bacterium]
MKVLFTPGARAEWLAALGHIRAGNPAAARRFRKRAETVLRRLEKYPESGRRLPEFPDFPHREVIVAPYRFFYVAERHVVWVVAVWHGARLPAAPR